METLKAELQKRRDGCFLCRYIEDDLKRHGKFTGWPIDYVGHELFPVEGKLKHLKVEGVRWPGGTFTERDGVKRWPTP